MRVEDKLYSLFAVSEETHWWFAGRRKIVLSLVGKNLREKQNSKILDVGCGTGTTLRWLEKYGWTVGIDISKEAIGYCRERGCARLIRVEEEILPFKNRSFDCVVAMDVIEHIRNDRKALGEYRRLLKPGGFLLLTVPAYPWLWSWHDEMNRHQRRYTGECLRQALLNSGFSVMRLSYFCTYLFPLLALVRLGEKALNKIFHLRTEEFDFHIPADFINRLLSRIFSAEASWLLRRNFPYGSSLLTLSRKNKDSLLEKQNSHKKAQNSQKITYFCQK